MQKALPQLPFDNVAAAVAYYRDVLDFRINYAQEDLGVMAGKPCIRGMRVTVGMIVLADFPLSFAAPRELMRLLIDTNLTVRVSFLRNGVFGRPGGAANPGRSRLLRRLDPLESGSAG